MLGKMTGYHHYSVDNTILHRNGLKVGFSFLCTVIATWWLSLQVQSKPVNTDTKDAMESVRHINSVCIKPGHYYLSQKEQKY